jgi:preprotein translocase subunit SecE
MVDKIKLGIAALLVAAAVWGFYYLGASPMIARLGVILAGVLLATAVAWTSEPGKRFYVYSQEAIAETRKVVWPARKETVQTTGVVVAFVIVMAIFLWIVDAILARMVDLLV